MPTAWQPRRSGWLINRILEEFTYDKITNEITFIGKIPGFEELQDRVENIETEDLPDLENQIAINRNSIGIQTYNYIQCGAGDRDYSGIYYTVNDDGSFTMNGTRESTSTQFIWTNYRTGAIATGDQYDNYRLLPPGEYILTGGGHNGCVGIQVLYGTAPNSHTAVLASNYGGEPTRFTVTEEHKYIWIRVRVGGDASIPTYDNETFYPMIRPADITTNDYVPYKPNLQAQVDNLKMDLLANFATQTGDASGSTSFELNTGANQALITITTPAAAAIDKTLELYLGSVSPARLLGKVKVNSTINHCTIEYNNKILPRPIRKYATAENLSECEVHDITYTGGAIAVRPTVKNLLIRYSDGSTDYLPENIVIRVYGNLREY